MPKKKEQTSELDALRKRLGIMKASEVRPPHLIRLPTGLASLDVALAGGFPRGKIIELAGPESAGKTLLSLQTAANLQALRGKKARILMATPEGGIDKEFCRKIGFVIPFTKDEIRFMEAERKRLGRPPLTDEDKASLAREVCPVDQLPVDTAEKMLQSIIEAAKSDEYDLIILDSISVLIAGDDVLRTKGNKEEEIPVGGERPFARSINGIIGSFTNRWFLEVGKESHKGRPNMTTLIAISQVRADTNATSSRGFGWKVAGSFALKHAKSVDIWVYQGTRMKKDDEIIGRRINWMVAKAKYGVQEGAKSSVPFYLNRGFDTAEALFDACQEHGLARSQGGGTWDLITKEGEVVEEYGRDVGGMMGLVERLRKSDETRALWTRTLHTLYENEPIIDPEYWEER